jgi:hypothetical protein
MPGSPEKRVHSRLVIVCQAEGLVIVLVID